MGVTNGFLKLSRDKFHGVKDDAEAFTKLARQREESTDYLDMDKAGHEILFMLDPGLLDPASSGQLPFPSVAKVLSGGETIFPDLDLGYGPAQIVDESAMKNSIPESSTISICSRQTRGTSL